MSRVLVVEDSPTQAEKLRLILEMGGFRAQVAGSGDEALALLRRQPFELVVSDVVMPGISGYELCRQVRESEDLHAIPFLLLTARKDPLDIINGLECGADAFLTKPYDPEQLVARISSLLRNKDIRSDSRFSMGAELHIFGKRVKITASKEQIFNLLISTFEDIHATNLELKKSRESLAAAKAELETHARMVQDLLTVSQQELHVRNQAIEALHSGMVIIDVSTDEFIVVDANAAFFSMTGFDAGDVIGKPFTLLPCPLTEPTVLARVQGALANTEPVVETVRSYRRDGSSFWSEISLRPIKAHHGSVRYYVGILRDVTGQRRFERAMQVVSTELNALEGIDYYQRAVIRLADILEMDIGAICRRERGGAEDVIDSIALAEAGHIVADISYTIAGTPCERVLEGHSCVITRGVRSRYPDDAWLAEKGVEAYAGEPIKDSSGCVVGHLMVLGRLPLPDEPVVAQILQLFALAIGAAMTRERNHRQYQALFEFAPDAMIMADNEGAIQLVNRQAELLFGWERGELPGQPVETLIPRYAQSRQMARHQGESGALAALAPEEAAKLHGVRRDGSEFPVEISLGPMETEAGLMVAAAVRDITERMSQQEDRLAREAAERANQAKSSFLATMSHEIRTPMNGVIGCVDLLARSSLKPHQVELVETIRDSAFSLLSVLDDVLDFSKIEAGRLELEREPVSLQRLVEVACEALKPVAVNKGVRLLLFTSPGLPPWILSDSIRLRQILSNLISNAIKFSGGQGRRGRVVVRVEPAGESAVRLSIADNGIGISPDVQAKLFRPFVQAEASTTRRFGGTGLGLAICQRLIEAFGGRLCVDSAPGRGSTFSATLPVAVTTGPVAPAPELDGLQCLVATGDRQQARDWCVYLEQAGASASACWDDRHTLRQRLAGLPPDRGVLIFEGEWEEVRQWSSEQGLMSLPPLVAVGTGRRQMSQRLASGVVELDGNAMSRSTFLNAVAIAAGRAEPAREEEEFGLLSRHFLPPDRQTAVAQGRLILVAEDNEVNQKVIRHQLALLGLAADVVSNGREALNAWREGGYALLLSDLHMPLMDGLELTRAIRVEEKNGARLPIVALTANALKEEAEHCMANGMDDYLSKPTTLERLEATLKKWLPEPTADARAVVEPADHGAGLAVLDTGVLAQLVGDEPVLIDEFVRDFRHLLEEAAGQLRSSIAAADCYTVAAVAHRLLSSSRAMGALALSDCCERIEKAGKARDIEGLQRLLTEFDHMLSAVSAAIDKA